MKIWLLSSCLLVCSSAIAQPTVYQAFEVDSVAEPRGGMAYWSTFLQANLQKPIQAEAKGMGGTVIVNGIIEQDGRISTVNVIKSLRPDCDREAKRVVSLFNAWKPAFKQGKVVRQLVTVPITFKPNEPFTYANNERINYFDAANKPVPDSSDQAQFKQVMPLDTNGMPAGDIVIYKAKGKNWKESYRLPFVRVKNGQRSTTGRPDYWIGNQDANLKWQGYVYNVDDSGRLIDKTYYTNGAIAGPQFTYHENGVVAEKREELDTRNAVTSWYPTGQIRQIRSTDKARPIIGRNPELVIAVWDSTGHQLVKDGNGRAIYSDKVKSYSDSGRQTTYIQQGLYENNLKQGIWTGHYVDGSYFYEEFYDKGTCTGGKAKIAQGDTVQYTELEKLPEFKGGMPALGKFLAQTLRYPPDAQRARVQGRVLVSFVIDTDGSVADIRVEHGIGFGADDEAVRVVKASNGQWTPATQRGQKVRVKYVVPVNFAMQ